MRKYYESNYQPRGNYVAWFKKAIESFGGEFEPIVVEKSLDKHGRRVDTIARRRRELSPETHFLDNHGSVRRSVIEKLRKNS